MFGNFFNCFTRYFGMPNLFSNFRQYDLLLIMVATITIRNSVSKGFLLSIGFFIFLYIFVGVWQEKPFESFYFIRLYIEPLFAMFLFVKGKQIRLSEKYVSYFKSLGVAAVAISIWSVYVYYTDSIFSFILHSGEKISYSWFVSTDRYYRAGYPMGGPNQQGWLYTGLLILTIVYPCKSKVNQLFYLFLFLLGLSLTYSKSGFALLLIFLLFYNKSPYRFFRFILYLMVGLYLFFLFNEAFMNIDLSDWLGKLTSVRDTSNEGHYKSIINAFNSMSEYIWYGYPRGTVGPKGSLFCESFINVENSFFIMLFDMGLFLTLIYLVSIFFIFLATYFHPIQKEFLIGLIVVFNLLPFVQEADITSLMFVIYILLGTKYTVESKNDINTKDTLSSFVTSELL